MRNKGIVCIGNQTREINLVPCQPWSDSSEVVSMFSLSLREDLRALQAGRMFSIRIVPTD